MNEKMQKVKNLVEKHKVEIAWFGGVTFTVLAGTLVGKAMLHGKGKYKAMVFSDNKEYIDGVVEFFSNHAGKQYTGAGISLNQSASKTGDIVNKFIGEGDSDDYLYDMIITKINKKDI